MAVVFAVQDSVHVREMRFGCELGRLRLHREKGCRQGRHVSDSGVMLPPTLRGDFSGVLRVPRMLSRRGSTAVLRRKLRHFKLEVQCGLVGSTVGSTVHAGS